MNLEAKEEQAWQRSYSRETRFPSMTFDLVGGGKLRIPEDMPGRYAAVLFYRGHW